MTRLLVFLLFALTLNAQQPTSTQPLAGRSRGSSLPAARGHGPRRPGGAPTEAGSTLRAQPTVDENRCHVPEQERVFGPDRFLAPPLPSGRPSSVGFAGKTMTSLRRCSDVRIPT